MYDTARSRPAPFCETAQTAFRESAPFRFRESALGKTETRVFPKNNPKNKKNNAINNRFSLRKITRERSSPGLAHHVLYRGSTLLAHVYSTALKKGYGANQYHIGQYG